MVINCSKVSLSLLLIGGIIFVYFNLFFSLNNKYYIGTYIFLNSIRLKDICQPYVPFDNNEAYKYAFKTNRHKFCGDSSQDLPNLTPLSKKNLLRCDLTHTNMWDSKVRQKFQASLKHFQYEKSPIRLEYDIFVDLPFGFQDSSGAIVNDHLISIGGFCGGNHEWEDGTSYCCGPRGFTKETFALKLHTSTTNNNSSNNNNNKGICYQWKQLPKFPGLPRQGHRCTLVKKHSMESSMYCWGGYSYTPLKASSKDDKALLMAKKKDAYGFIDGYSLRFDMGTLKWLWKKLPDLPNDFGSFVGICTCENNKIYVSGGADYDSNQFHTYANRNNESKGLGAELWEFDIREETWLKLPSLPGTARFESALTCINNIVYAIGGATEGVSYNRKTTFSTVIDNWEYDTNLKKWSRLPDTPIVSGNFVSPAVFKNRYIFLMGGYGYDSYISNNVKHKTKIRAPHLDHRVNSAYYSNGALVFDSVQKKFFLTDPLPINNNGPLVLINGDDLYIIGGETGIGCVFDRPVGRHSYVVLKAKIKA